MRRSRRYALLSHSHIIPLVRKTETGLTYIVECFAAKLQIILQMPAIDFRAEAALIEIGVDSLVAVEIRSWFLKEASVDVAVLKILGGASTMELCKHAVEQMPKEMLRSVGTADKPSPDLRDGMARTNDSIGHANGSATMENEVHTNGAVASVKRKTPIKPVFMVGAAEVNYAARNGLTGDPGLTHMNGLSHAGVDGKDNGRPTGTNGHGTITEVAQLSVEKAVNNGGLNGAMVRKAT